jgi:hypothetical protein
MKNILNILAISFLLTLQWAVLPFTGVNWLLPPLILPVTLAWAEAGRPAEAMIWGAGSIFLWDILSYSFGKVALASILAFAVVYFGLRYIVHLRGRAYAVLSIFFTSILYFAFFDLFSLIFGLDYWSTFFSVLLPAIILSIIFWFFYPIFTELTKIVEAWEAGRKSFLK